MTATTNPRPRYAERPGVCRLSSVRPRHVGHGGFQASAPRGYIAKKSVTSALADSHRRQIPCSRGASG